jgi:F420-non-reducing hydrogenase small subunit
VTGTAKLQIALYWGAACGGCDVAVLDTDEFILDIAAAADIRFWPIAIDGKYADLEAMKDGELDIAFFSGAVRNSENEHVATLLRKKSKLMAAFGSCAYMGGIAGLANFVTREQIVTTAYLNNPTIEPGNRTVPTRITRFDGIQLEIPAFYRRVYRLSDVVEVDYFIPGCPPAPEQVKSVILSFVRNELPPPPAVVGASERSLCQDCDRKREEKRIKKFFRPYEIIQDPVRCLLEQGILCMGSATRSGCGARCPKSNQGCRGCYGPAPEVRDQGAKFLSAVASIVDSKDPSEIEEILKGLPDFAACAYRFGLPASILQRSHRP